MSEASYQRWLQRYEQRQEREEEARTRGFELFVKTLDSVQFGLLVSLDRHYERMDRDLFVPVVGRYGNYHISTHTTLCFGTNPSTLFCLHPGSYFEQDDLPVWDYLAMHKLMLDAEEEEFLWLANQQMASQALLKKVAVDMKMALTLTKMGLELMPEDAADERELAQHYIDGLTRTTFEPHPLAGVIPFSGLLPMGGSHRPPKRFAQRRYVVGGHS